MLVDEMAETLGEEVCRDKLLYEMVSLADDPVFKVRRELVLRLVRMARIMGQQIFVGVMVPVYRKLSTDAIWSVRKACVEILPEMSAIATKETK